MQDVDKVGSNCDGRVMAGARRTGRLRGLDLAADVSGCRSLNLLVDREQDREPRHDQGIYQLRWG